MSNPNSDGLDELRQKLMDFAWPELKGRNEYAKLAGFPKEHVDDMVSYLEAHQPKQPAPDDAALCDHCGYAEWRHREEGFECPRLKEVVEGTDEIRTQLRNLDRTDKQDSRYPIDAYEDDLVELIQAREQRLLEGLLAQSKTIMNGYAFSEYVPVSAIQKLMRRETE